jgi:hypothetical protein
MLDPATNPRHYSLYREFAYEPRSGLKFQMNPARNPIPCLGLREMGMLGF